MSAVGPKAPRRRKPRPGHVYMLRTCAPGMKGIMKRSAHFTWPTSGPVEAPDWHPEPVCGYGLHGLLRGVGRAEELRLENDSIWVVFEVAEDSVVLLEGGSKAKAPRGKVIFAGARSDAVAIVDAAYPDQPVIFSTRDRLPMRILRR